MKVDSSNNLVYVRPNAYGSIKKRSNPNFRGSLDGVTKEMASDTDKLVEHLLKNKKARAFINKFSAWQGELGGIMITAIGTGLIAPLSIAFNPFVKSKPNATEEEKKELDSTKKYTAMRQPISAALAILFQAGALKPIDKVINEMTNNPDIAKNLWVVLDRSALQNKAYLERTITQEMKKEGTAYADKKAFKEELAKRVKAREAEQMSKLADGLAETGKIQIGERSFGNKNVAEILNAQIDTYAQKAEHFKINDEGLAFYKNRANTLISNEAELKDLFAAHNLPAGEKELEEYLLKAKDATSSDGVKELIGEILERDPDCRESRCYRTLERIDKIKDVCNGEFTTEKYLAKMNEGNKELQEIIDGLNNLKIKDVAQADENIIKQTLEKIAEKCNYNGSDGRLRNLLEGSGTFLPDLKDVKAKVKKDAIEGYKTLVDANYKGFNQLSKVAIGVCITLPITCTALNWVYPRFMDIFFPSLSGAKKEPPKADVQKPEEAQIEEGGNK